MLRRSFLLATGATICTTGFARADAGAYSLTFVGHRNGQRIGTHVLVFREEAGRQTVMTQVDFTVHMLGFVAYRFRHHAHEVWSDGRFQAIVTETDDNGERYAVQAQRQGLDLVVRRREPRSFFKTSGGDEASEQQRWIHEVQPGHILPSTHWNIAQVRQRELLNTQTGKINHITVSEVGRETVRTATQAPPATRYAYGGDFHMNQWFDDHARWVKATFEVAIDGSTIEYILQA